MARIKVGVAVDIRLGMSLFNTRISTKV